MSANALTAVYAVPSSKETLSTSLPSLPAGANAGDVQQKTAYLSALRSSVTAMQSDINALLTQKMQEDKAAEDGKDSGTGKAQDDRAEELYGEEDVEDDA